VARRRGMSGRAKLGVVALVLVVAGVAGLVAGSGPATVVPTNVPLASGNLYVTTFVPPAVERVAFAVVHDHLQTSKPVVIARVLGGDGVIFGPDGQLLVGTVRTGVVDEVDPSTGQLHELFLGDIPSFHLALGLSGRVIYTEPGGASEPAALGLVSVGPSGQLGPGRVLALHGANRTLTAIAEAPDGTVLYTSSRAGGAGDIGTLNLRTGLTTRLFTNFPAAHGIVYDPRTNSFFVMGGDEVIQLSAANPADLVSELTIPGMAFDQGAVDGRGNLLLTSNTGKLVLVDYAASGRVGDTFNPVSIVSMAAKVSDVAPLVGPGAPPVATLARWWHGLGLAALFAGLVLGLGLAVGPARVALEERKNRRRLPRWDRRRQATRSLATRPRPFVP